MSASQSVLSMCGRELWCSMHVLEEQAELVMRVCCVGFYWPHSRYRNNNAIWKNCNNLVSVHCCSGLVTLTNILDQCIATLLWFIEYICIYAYYISLPVYLAVYSGNVSHENHNKNMCSWSYPNWRLCMNIVDCVCLFVYENGRRLASVDMNSFNT